MDNSFEPKDYQKDEDGDEEAPVGTSIRITPTNRERFKKLTSELGWTQDKSMELLMNTYEIYNAKTLLPGKKDLLDELDGHMERISHIVVNLLEHNLSIENMLKKEYEEKFKAKDEIIKKHTATVSSLKADVDFYKGKYRESLADQEKLTATLENVQTINKKNEIIIEDNQKKIALLEVITKENDKLKEDIEQLHHSTHDQALKINDLNNYLATSKSEIESLSQTISNISKERDSLLTSINDLNNELSKCNDVSKIKDAELSKLKDQLEFYKEQISELKGSHNAEIDRLREEHRTEIERLRTESKETISSMRVDHLEEIRSLKDDLRRLQEKL